MSDNFTGQVRISDFQFNNMTFPSPFCLRNSIYSSEICNETVLIQILTDKNDTFHLLSGFRCEVSLIRRINILLLTYIKA